MGVGISNIITTEHRTIYQLTHGSYWLQTYWRIIFRWKHNVSWSNDKECTTTQLGYEISIFVGGGRLTNYRIRTSMHHEACGLWQIPEAHWESKFVKQLIVRNHGRTIDWGSPNCCLFRYSQPFRSSYIWCFRTVESCPNRKSPHGVDCNCKSQQSDGG